MTRRGDWGWRVDQGDAAAPRMLNQLLQEFVNQFPSWF
jgi:hypothetical protein